MSIKIPEKVLRNILADVVFARSEAMERAFESLSQKAYDEGRPLNDYEGDVATEAAGTRILSDEIRCGNIDLKEVLNEILDTDEKQEVKNRVNKYIRDIKFQ